MDQGTLDYMIQQQDKMENLFSRKGLLGIDFTKCNIFESPPTHHEIAILGINPGGTEPSDERTPRDKIEQDFGTPDKFNWISFIDEDHSQDKSPYFRNWRSFLDTQFPRMVSGREVYVANLIPFKSSNIAQIANIIGLYDLCLGEFLGPLIAQRITPGIVFCTAAVFWRFVLNQRPKIQYKTCKVGKRANSYVVKDYDLAGFKIRRLFGTPHFSHFTPKEKFADFVRANI